MMTHLKLIMLGILLSNLTFGQTIKIQTGPAISKLDWVIGNTNLAPYNEMLIGYSVLTGFDYLETKYFNFSSNLGFIKKGGKGTITYLSNSGEPIGHKTGKAELDYFTLNTTLDLKYPIEDKVLPFICIGPRFDYLVSHSIEFDGIKEIDALEKFNLGLILGGGIKYNLSKIQVGVRADYYLNFYKIADWPVQSGNLGGEITDKTMTINLIVGYKL